MKKLKIKKWVTMLAGLTFVCGTVMVSCVDPVVTPAEEEFNFYLGSASSDKESFEFDSSKSTSVSLKLYPTSSTYLNTMVVAEIDNLTWMNEGNDDGEALDFDTPVVKSTATADYVQLKLKSDVIDTTKTCDYVMYVAKNSDAAKNRSFVKKNFKIVVGGNDIIYYTPNIDEQPVAAKYYYKSSVPGKYYSDVNCETEISVEALSVKASITEGSVSYQWYKDSEIIPNAINSSYTPTESGAYKVRVSNSESASLYVDSDTVQVNFIDAENPSPVITSDIKSATYNNVDEIETLSVTATVDSSTIDLRYQWYKNGVAIDGETSSSYKPSAFGTYYVEVWNVTASGSSEKVKSTVVTISENKATIDRVSPTEVTTIYCDDENNVSEVLTAEFKSNIDAEISYQWRYSENINASSDEAEDIENANEATYTATATGAYYCRAYATSKLDSSNKSNLLDSYAFKVTTEDPEDDEGSGNIGIDFN